MTVKTLRFETYGPPSRLTLVEAPLPRLGAGDVLVEVKAAAINPSDVKNVAGHFHTPLPRTPGRDFAGVVVDGALAKGLEVWGSGAGFGVVRDGSHATHLAVPAAWVSPKPANLSLIQAASIGVPYVTAWCALVIEGHLRAGETVLVVGATGAVGRAATQIARWMKARVMGAATRHDNPEGAERMINTRTQDLVAEVRASTDGRGVDLVLDAVGGALFEPALRCLRRGGRQIAISSSKERRVSFDLVDFYHNASHLIGVDSMQLDGPTLAGVMNELRGGFEAGNLMPPEITTWPFDRAVEAYEAVAKGDSRTKHVLLPG